MSKPVSVLVVGDAMLDVAIHGDCHRVAPEAPVPVVKVTNTTRSPGGAANVAANIAGLGGDVLLIYPGGAGDELTDVLNDNGVIGSASGGCLVPIKTRIFSGQHLVARYDAEAYLDSKASGELLDHARAVIEDGKHDVLVLSDYCKGAFNNQAARRDLITEAHERGIPVLVDSKESTAFLPRNVDLLTPNLTELINMSPGDAPDPEDDQAIAYMAAQVARKFETDVLVTRGPMGVLLVTEKDANALTVVPFLVVPAARPRQVYDVTGAGDTLLAALATVWTDTSMTMRDKLEYAVKAAAVAVSKPGTVVVKKEEVEAFDVKPTTPRPVIFNSAAEMLIEAARSGRIGMTTGCFDLLHAGHMNFLARAAARCDYLVVSVNSDMSVNRLKGNGRPVVSFTERVQALAHLPFNGAIIPQFDDDPTTLIDMVKPHVFFKGEEYRDKPVIGVEHIKSWGGYVELIPMTPGLSTTTLVEKVKNDTRVEANW